MDGPKINEKEAGVGPFKKKDLIESDQNYSMHFGTHLLI